MYINIRLQYQMKPIDVKSNTNIDLDVENNEKDPKFKVVDHVTILTFCSTSHSTS